MGVEVFVCTLVGGSLEGSESRTSLSVGSLALSSSEWQLLCGFGASYYLW
jgi:hypothetical protein